MKTPNIRNIIILVLMILFYGIFGYVTDGIYLLRIAPSFLGMLAIVYWMVSVWYRIDNSHMRHLTMMIGVMQLLWDILAYCKYYLMPDSINIRRYLWYLYYIPMTSIPALSFMAACHTSTIDDEHKMRRHRAVVYISFVLAALVLTNDFHGLVFRFKTDRWIDSEPYSYGPGYYIILIWILMNLVSTCVVAARHCRGPIRKSKFLAPATDVLLSTIYFLAYYFKGGAPEFRGYSPYSLHTAFSIMVVGFWECLIFAGLIRTNFGYEDFFSGSCIGTMLTDEDCEPQLVSVNAPATTVGQRVCALNGPVLLTPDIRLKSRNIRSGYVYWTEDLTAINGLNGRIAELNDELIDEQQLLARENELESERTALELHNQLYNVLAKQMEPKFENIEKLLEKADDEPEDLFREHLAMACVYNVYIKRRCNLMLLASDRDTSDCFELTLAIEESMENLRQLGITSGVFCDLDEEFDISILITAYDLFENIIEEAIPKLESIMVNISGTAEEFKFTISLSSPESAEELRTDVEWLENAVIRVEQDGNEMRIILLLPGRRARV